MQLLPHSLRAVWRVDRDGNYGGASLSNFFQVVAVVRQLAKAKGSPVSAIKKEHDRAV